MYVENVQIISYSLAYKTTTKVQQMESIILEFLFILNCWTNCGCYVFPHMGMKCMFLFVCTFRHHHFICVIIVLIRLNHVVIWIYWVKHSRFKTTHKHKYKHSTICSCFSNIYINLSLSLYNMYQNFRFAQLAIKIKSYILRSYYDVDVPHTFSFTRS